MMALHLYLLWQTLGRISHQSHRVALLLPQKRMLEDRRPLTIPVHHQLSEVRLESEGFG
jgi:hypothetical protein